ncbi:hypothetical protein ACFQ3R_05860 [Mesonia ostreae]|uniref:Uncharacterized protein n=1 Tax=Mesonia ostreae TaxID=861110 RepID=A0ABU2KJU7_9FLAO|nr:hypothetical protein [Mesonia ostreae]MDT0294949.1 hypothetical protein [Mesonia ostreae]
MNISKLTILSILLLIFTLSSCESEPVEGELEAVTENPTDDNSNDQDNDSGDNQDGDGNNDGDGQDNNGNDDEEDNSNFTIGNTDYSTPIGYMISDFDGTNNSVHAIYLLNGSFLNNEFYGQGCDFSSDLTQGVVFNLRSTSVSELESGTYEYELNTFQPSLNETNISTNMVVIDNCVTNSNSISEDQIISGTIIIEVSNAIYTLNYTFETIDYGTINGTYTGELQLVQDLS